MIYSVVLARDGKKNKLRPFEISQAALYDGISARYTAQLYTLLYNDAGR